MAHDLYGELLARALQRRAPPGHFPAFVTPGEANLLRSQGGGVAPGGGQYMAGGIPAFFSEADPSGAVGSPSVSGDDPSGGLGNIGALGFGTGGGAFGGMAGEFGSMGFDIGNLGIVSEGEHGRSPQDIAREAARIAAARNIAIAIEEAQTRNIQQDQPVAPAVAPTISIEPAPEVSAPPAVSLAQDVEDVTSAISSQVDPSFAAGVEDFTPGGWETPGFEGEQGIGTPTDPGDTSSDSGIDQAMDNIRSADRSIDQAMDLGVSFEDANQSAMDALGGNINEGGMGRFSPANGWGLRSEVALDNIDNKRPIGITIADLAALNAQDHQGYAITNPQPTAASIAASHVFSQLNPTVANAVIGLSSLVAPGPVGFAATIAALMEEKGLLNIPAMRSIPGIQAISDILDIPQDFVAEIMRGITDPIGDVLSQGTDALADALSGFLGPEESAGPDDAGEVDGGAPDIEPVPPITTPEPKPEPPARTFADVDDATRRRILANVISGLQRTDRPTEGVTAFGPLYGKNFPEGSGDDVYEIQPYPRNTFA